MLCDNLERWDGGGMRGRLKREEIDVYIQFIHSVVQQKLTALYSNHTPIIKKKRTESISFMTQACFCSSRSHKTTNTLSLLMDEK